MSDVEYEEGDANTYDDAEGDRGNDSGSSADNGAAAGAVTVLEYLAKSIVEHPDALEIVVDESRKPVRLNVHADPDDLGRLIGRRGRVAQAIRTVVRAAASRDDLNVDVEFID